MALYSVSVRTTSLTVDQAALEIYTPVSLGVRVWEIGIFQLTAGSAVYGLGRPRAQGVTPGGTSSFQAEQSTVDPAAKTVIALSWATSPTSPLVYLRRACTNLATSGVVWMFPRGLYIPVSSSLVLWNITTGLASDVHIVIDE